MTKLSDLDFLRFVDYAGTKEHENSEWITVMRHDDYKLDDGSSRDGSWSTICALMPDDKAAIQELAGRYDWEIGWDFMESGKNKIIELFQKETKQWKEICEFKPLVHGDWEYCRLVKDFVDHFNLSYDAVSGKYSDSSGTVVAVFDSHGLRISTHLLKQYLKDKALVLIRYHEHKRRIDRPTIEILGEEPQETHIIDEKRLYNVFIGSIDPKSQNTFSMLRGKDIVS